MDRETRRKFYWILATDPDTNKPFLLAGGDTETEARAKAFEMLSGLDFEIRGLYTRNMARASQIVRGRRLEDTHSLSAARERLGHSKSINRMLRRRHDR